LQSLDIARSCGLAPQSHGGRRGGFDKSQSVTLRQFRACSIGPDGKSGLSKHSGLSPARARMAFSGCVGYWIGWL
jgi:hypothetical protein